MRARAVELLRGRPLPTAAATAVLLGALGLIAPLLSRLSLLLAVIAMMMSSCAHHTSLVSRFWHAAMSVWPNS